MNKKLNIITSVLFFLVLILPLIPIFLFLLSLEVQKVERQSIYDDGIPVLPSFYGKSKFGKEWHSLDLGAFKLDLPKEFKYYKFRGIDSFVGEFRCGKQTLSFDYGLYSDDLSQYYFDDDFVTYTDTICGFPAVIVTEKKSESSRILGFSIQKIQEYNLIVAGNIKMDTAIFFQIFRSLIINDVCDGDGKKISQMKNMRENKHFLSVMSGEEIAKSECKQCHSTYDGIGRDFEFIANQKSKKEIVRFLTKNREGSSKEDGCVQFSFNRDEVNDIANYIESLRSELDYP